MSTRGLWGIREGKKELGMCSPFDSYPARLGYGLMIGLRNIYPPDLKKIAREFGVKYNKLKNENEHYFIYDSLWCEWAYMINLEAQTFEVYRGLNKDPQEAGPYASKKAENSNEYYGCRLLFEIPLKRINLMTDEEIKSLCLTVQFLSNIFSLKKFDYECNSKQVQIVVKNATELLEIMKKQKNKNEILNILYSIQEIIKPKRIKSDLDFAVSLSEKSADLEFFAPILEIYLSQNKKFIELIESFSGKNLEQLDELRRYVNKKQKRR